MNDINSINKIIKKLSVFSLRVLNQHLVCTLLSLLLKITWIIERRMNSYFTRQFEDIVVKITSYFDCNFKVQ